MATISRDFEPFDYIHKLSLYMLVDQPPLGRREAKKLARSVLAKIGLRPKSDEVSCRGIGSPFGGEPGTSTFGLAKSVIDYNSGGLVQLPIFPTLMDNPLMRLDASFLVELRELVSTNDTSQLANLSFSELTIGAVVELSCVRASTNRRLRLMLDEWAKSSQVLGNAFQVLEHGTLPSTSDMWAAKKVDFFPVRGANWSDDRNYHPFESRFRKAAKEAGFGDKSDALTGALFEMADNIAQHSGSTSTTPCPGLIGYYIDDGHVAFAVGDSGRGVLASLKENLAWAHLPNSKEALVAVINNHASRRPDLGDGEGFKQVFRSLADLNGLVILCSQEGRLRLHQTPQGRQATAEFTGAFPGVQLSVNCSLNGSPQEREISI